MITFSIITPSFNQAKYIEQNIKSVLNQDYPYVEHIIIDGGSQDGTINILKKYPHLKWISEPDRGQSDALNKGFKLAKGEIIGWLNSDDFYIPRIFSVVADKFEDENVMAVCGDGYEVDENGDIIRPLLSRFMKPDDLIRYWRWRYEFVQPSLFFRRNLLEKVGYLDENLHYAMDYDFLIRLGKNYQIHYIPQPIANLRLYPESKTGRNVKKVIPVYIREMHRVSKRYWGRPTEIKFYSYCCSFITALFYSILKNIFFTPTSKSRQMMKNIFKAH